MWLGKVKLSRKWLFPLFCYSLLSLWFASSAATNLTLYVSSNLYGRFSVQEDEEKQDFMLDFATALLSQRASEPGIYLDLGNGFYPGALSRFSYGALMADYFTMLKLDAALVGAGDLYLGSHNLDFLQKARSLNLLSANILREGKPMFADYRILNTPIGRVAVVGMTSRGSFIDFAERQILSTEIVEGTKQLGAAIQAAKENGAQYVILMTSSSIRSVVDFLENYPDIQLALLGGDSKGDIGGKKFASLQLPDGRMLLVLNENMGFYRLRLTTTEGKLTLISREYLPVLPRLDDQQIPSDFLRRRELWRNGYLRSEVATIVNLPEKGFLFNAEYLGTLLRSELGCEVAVINPSAINTTQFQKKISAGLLREKIFDDYHVFEYRLLGQELENLLVTEANLFYSGVTRLAPNLFHIQGYPIKKNHWYRVCSSQTVMERLQQSNQARRFLAYNTWRSLGDIATAQLNKSELYPATTLSQIAEHQWRLRLDALFSNSIEKANVLNQKPIRVPPGQPRASYLRWGLENTLDITFYNRLHEFILTPYINYLRQDELFLQNLLRGTFTYNYNLDFFLRPYHKSQIDTVVIPANNTRPTVIRETIGSQIRLGELTGRLGFGFEKQALDPVRDPTWGFETTLKFNYTLWQRITYRMSLDAFFSTQNLQGRWQIRSEISNALVFTIYGPLSLTFRHLRFYFFSTLENGAYDNSVFTTSIDLRTSFKVY